MYVQLFPALERTLRRSRVDAFGKPGYHAYVMRNQFPCNFASPRQALLRCLAGANYGNTGKLEVSHIAPVVQYRRWPFRVFQLCRPRGRVVHDNRKSTYFRIQIVLYIPIVVWQKRPIRRTQGLGWQHSAPNRRLGDRLERAILTRTQIFVCNEFVVRRNGNPSQCFFQRSGTPCQPPINLFSYHSQEHLFVETGANHASKCRYGYCT